MSLSTCYCSNVTRMQCEKDGTWLVTSDLNYTGMIHNYSVRLAKTHLAYNIITRQAQQIALNSTLLWILPCHSVTVWLPCPLMWVYWADDLLWDFLNTSSVKLLFVINSYTCNQNLKSVFTDCSWAKVVCSNTYNYLCLHFLEAQTCCGHILSIYYQKNK